MNKIIFVGTITNVNTVSDNKTVFTLTAKDNCKIQCVINKQKHFYTHRYIKSGSLCSLTGSFRITNEDDVCLYVSDIECVTLVD